MARDVFEPRFTPVSNPTLALIAIVGILAAGRGAGAQVVLDGALHPLGTADQPGGRGLTVRFRGEANPKEATLLLRQRGATSGREVRLNGRAIGHLVLDEADLVHAVAVPVGTMREGENVLEIGPSGGPDDAVVGEFQLDPRPRDEALRRSTLDVRVTDGDSGRDLPCRITVVDDRGVLAPVFVSAAPHLAVRPGVVYTANGRARLGLRPGRYTVHATRGFEYGLATRTLTPGEGQEIPLALAIRREVPTPGQVACDPHVAIAGEDGDRATIEERLVETAGEGIELPVTADPDRRTDVAVPAQRLGLRTVLTPVLGEEVTTPRGHFAAFPFGPDAAVPDSRNASWAALFRELRAGSSDRVIVLAHPRDRIAGYRPFGEENFNPVTGEDRSGASPDFDAVEVINSGAPESDPMRLVRDWFAIGNRGREIAAVGAGGGHDTRRSLVGQARTYVDCPDEDPGRIDVGKACRALRDGRSSVSLGLLVQMKVEGRFRPGDLATGIGDPLRVSVSVLGPSWTRADRVELYSDGIKVREQRIEEVPGAVEKARVEWSLPRPAQDVSLVAVASGPGVAAPYWPMARPRGPASKGWQPRVLGLTNPIRVDADGDGRWFSPRYYAQFLIEIRGTEPSALFRALAPFDEAVAAQAAAFCLASGLDERDPGFAEALESAPDNVRRGFSAVEESLRPPATAGR